MKLASEQEDVVVGSIDFCDPYCNNAKRIKLVNAPYYMDDHGYFMLSKDTTRITRRFSDAHLVLQ